MWKIKTISVKGSGIKRKSKQKKTEHSTIYQLLFAIAMTVGIKPKKLAKFLNKDEITKYAEELTKELEQKEHKDLLDKVNRK